MYTSKRRLSTDEQPNAVEGTTGKKKMADAEVEGVRYKVVWSCLLLVEMVMTDIACAAHFKALATNLVGKVSELLRLFNSRSTQLVLGAGAIHSAARLKSINAKHLSLVTQCVGLIISILPHVRAALMAQLPAKQHTLLNDLDTIKKEYEEHNEKVLNKFVNIIGGIVEHGLAPRIGNTNFDERAKERLPDVPVTCCVFLEGISTNTRKMHQVLSSLLPPDHLQDSFSRIFAYLDQKLPELFIAASLGNPPSKPPIFSLPSTDQGKKQLLLEVQTTTDSLNELAGVRPWDFSAVSVLEQELDYKLHDTSRESASNGPLVEQLAKDETNNAPEVSQLPSANDAESDSALATAVSAQLATEINSEGDYETNSGSQPILSDANGAEQPVTLSSDSIQPPAASKGFDPSVNENRTVENENGDLENVGAEVPIRSNGSSEKVQADKNAVTTTKEESAHVQDSKTNLPAEVINGDVP